MRAAKRSSPAYRPTSPVRRAESSMIFGAGSPWRCPVSKSLASWAGVILRAPVPKAGSTAVSATTGMSRSGPTGSRSIRPMASRKRGSSGWTATAVSPRIVSGRVVATTIPPSPAANGYRM